MPSISSDYEADVQIDDRYDGIVMLSQSGVFFNDADSRPDGRKIYHIFEHAGDVPIVDNCPYKLSDERKFEFCSKASENTFENIQEALERNGIPVEDWCPPLTENVNNTRNHSWDSTEYSEKIPFSSPVFINDGILDEGCKIIENVNGENESNNRGKENRDKDESSHGDKRVNENKFFIKTENNSNGGFIKTENNSNGGSSKIFNCSYCNFATGYKFNLKSHVMIRHSKVKRFQCSSCTFESNYRYNIKTHILKHPDHKFVAVNVKLPSADAEAKSLPADIEQDKSLPAVDAVVTPIADENESILSAVIKDEPNMDEVIGKDPIATKVTGKKSNGDVFFKLNDLKVNIIRFNKKELQDLNNGINNRIFLRDSGIVVEKTVGITNNTKKCKLKKLNPITQSLFEDGKKLFKSSNCSYKTVHRCKIIQHNLTHKKNITYYCKDCDFTAKCLYLLKQHKKEHTEKELLTCEFCSFKTYNYSTYRKHKYSVACKERIIKCDDCSYTADSTTELREHSLTHKKPIFRCDKCFFATTNKIFFDKHMMDHKSKVISFKCCKCSFTSDSKDALMTHTRSHENQKQNIFKCRKCSFRTSDKSTLIAHMKNHKAKNLKCLECSFTAKNRNDLLVHNTSRHVKREIFDCLDCPFRTTFKLKLIKHKLTHQVNDTDVFKCSECSFKASKEKILQTHILSHVYSKMHKCRRCDFSSNSKTTLNVHMRTHKALIEKTNNRCFKKNKLTVQLVSKNSQSFTCFKCDYTCATEHLLNQHSLTHLETKIMKCEHCDYETNFKGNLVKHVLIHVDEYIIN